MMFVHCNLCDAIIMTHKGGEVAILGEHQRRMHETDKRRNAKKAEKH